MKDILSDKSVSHTAKLLLILEQSKAPLSVPDIRKIAINNGFGKAKKLNIGQLLKSAEPRTIKLPEGWEISTAGRKWLTDQGVTINTTILNPFAQKLRSHLARLSDNKTREFLEEAVECLEHKFYRAAVVLTWVGAVSVLQDHVLANCLADFNRDAIANNLIKKPITNKDGLSRIKEDDFLIALARTGVLTKNEKEELKKCLERRNGCGHPNTYVIREPGVADHIDSVLINAFEKFSA